MIYLDNAATTLRKPPGVAEAVVHAMTYFGNSSRGTYDEALAAARTVYGTRVKLAEMFGCRPDHVIFTSNATEALNIAISGIIGEGDHVITTDLEHNSVLRPLYRLETERNVSLSFAKSDEKGRIDSDQLESLFRTETKAVICTHASNLTGDLLDISKIGKMARAHGALMIVDASQTAGSFNIRIDDSDVDVICFTGHKGLMGPQGTGGLCIREGVDIRPFKVGGSGVQSYSMTQPEEYPTRLEAGTLNSHGIAGLSASLDFIKETGIENIHARETQLMKLFYDSVKDVDGVIVYGDMTRDRAPIVSLNIRDIDSGEVSDELAEAYGIATRPGAHCAPRIHKALGTEYQGAVRFSFGYFNTVEEVRAAAEAVKEIAG